MERARPSTNSACSKAQEPMRYGGESGSAGCGSAGLGVVAVARACESTDQK